MRQVSHAAIATLAAALVITAPLSARAAERAGVTMPDHITASGRPLFLRGMGVHEVTIFRLDVFVAGLYLERPNTPGNAILDSDQIKVLHLHFKRHVSRDRIVNGVFAQLRAQLGGETYRRLADPLKRLSAMIPSFAGGDTLTICQFPGRGLQVEVNGRLRGTVPSELLARSVFSLWLGPHASSARLKRELLGGR